MALDPATLGFILPDDQDWMRDGDDAISENARVTARLFDTRSFYRGRIPNGSDVFTLADGAWTVSSAGFAGTMTNLPEQWPGTFIIIGNTEPIVKAAEFRPYGRDYRWETVTQGADGGGWMTWRKIIPGGSGSASDGLSPYAENAIRQAQMIHHYGRVDTGGLGAVAWRIDHGLANFKAKLLPIFRAAGIVPMITLNSRSWGNSENAGVTQSEVNQWVANGWVEISNHGATHSNVTGDEAIEAYVSEGLSELEAQLPAAKGKIFGFHIAGVGVTGAFGGFQGGSTPEQWGTTMGRAILRHHAFGSGHISGTDLRVLDGQIRQGLLHMATDARPVSEITAQIDAAIATGRGFQLMSHPSTLDTGELHTTAMIQQIVDYIVSKRTAGQLAVLSPYQMMVADSAMSERDTGSLTATSTFSEVTNGQIYLRRIGNMVHVTLYDVEFGDSTPPDFFYLADRLPIGYRPAALTSFPALAGNDSVRRVRFQPDGRVLFYTITASSRLNLTASYLTPDSWPS